MKLFRMVVLPVCKVFTNSLDKRQSTGLRLLTVYGDFGKQQEQIVGKEKATMNGTSRAVYHRLFRFKVVL